TRLAKSRDRLEQKAAKPTKRDLSEVDIGNVLEHIDYGDDYLAARRHVVHGLNAGYQGEEIITAWSTGKRF
ncbi:MAG: hypothetical protein M3Z40_10730, partial [Bifidobacterium sp.]|nr:hypothetical protein [Bifidobacterium sp.]